MSANKNTTRLASRWCLSYCLAAPCEMGSVFHYASVSPSRNAGCLLSFLVDVNLAFLQSPSAQSAYHLSKSLTVDVFSIAHCKCISTPPLNISWINFWHLRMAFRVVFQSHQQSSSSRPKHDTLFGGNTYRVNIKASSKKARLHIHVERSYIRSIIRRCQLTSSSAKRSSCERRF
jgi:hypothetical protein